MVKGDEKGMVEGQTQNQTLTQTQRKRKRKRKCPEVPRGGALCDALVFYAMHARSIPN